MDFNKSVLIAQVFNKGAALDQTEIDCITPLFQDECIKEGDFFIRTGMLVTKVAFVVTGLLRRYSTNDEGQDVTLQLITEDHFCGDLDGWFRRKPSAAHVQAITNCHLLTISLNELDKLRDSNPKFSAIIHFISEEAMYERIETEELMRTGTILEKYEHFLTHYSKWASRIALRDLASFLQISQHMLTQIEEKAINLYH
ncbi:MAG: cyclic nucleotide-binding domain-containing protein [Verrucomicrobia bacterium]|nr:cyclic nucleotide-binding domain-containing protein [Prolixibacteraceae bacterium]